MRLADLLVLAVEQGASDLHLAAGLVPLLRLHGELVRLNLPSLDAAIIHEMLQEVLPQRLQAHFAEQGEVDFALSLPHSGRFRINAFRQRGAVGLACRLIPRQIMSLSTLGLPPVVEQFSNRRQGLILITGPAGSGKSTTLAAIIDKINRERAVHILSIEDPIEFVHTHQRSLVNQREIGSDTKSYANGLRAALREDPDVILIGEMRDLETTMAAVSAAETGHLVFASLHTPGAAETVYRILDIFPPQQQQQIRAQLALALQAVVSQQLLPRLDKPGRVLATEVMLATPAIRNLIREGKVHQINSLLQAGAQFGMQTMEQSLQHLAQCGLICGSQIKLYSSDAELLVGDLLQR